MESLRIYTPPTVEPCLEETSYFLCREGKCRHITSNNWTSQERLFYTAHTGSITLKLVQIQTELTQLTSTYSSLKFCQLPMFWNEPKEKDIKNSDYLQNSTCRQ